MHLSYTFQMPKSSKNISLIAGLTRTLFVCTASIIFLIVNVSCKKKNNDVADEKIIDTIKGKVINVCTDSGAASVKVFLRTYQDGKVIHVQDTFSDTNGSFEFRNVTIHTDRDFYYSLFIPGKSGGVSSNPALSEVRFDGDNTTFYGDSFSEQKKLFVTPGFALFRVYFINEDAKNEDTLRVTFTQNTFHKNVSSFPYQFKTGAQGADPNQEDYLWYYPMGKYEVTIKKQTKGLFIEETDTIYLPFGASRNYTVFW
jgi:hypothetical protein